MRRRIAGFRASYVRHPPCLSTSLYLTISSAGHDTYNRIPGFHPTMTLWFHKNRVARGTAAWGQEVVPMGRVLGRKGPQRHHNTWGHWNPVQRIGSNSLFQSSISTFALTSLSSVQCATSIIFRSTHLPSSGCILLTSRYIRAVTLEGPY